METTTKLYTLNYHQVRTYAFAVLFAVGNIALPPLFHLVPDGGLVWLPIYFFTLIAAYKYGLNVGLLTAILSPLANSLLFGMPAAEILPVILTKSALLAVVAAYASQFARKISLPVILAVVITAQFLGMLTEWVLLRDFFAALQKIQIAVPGLLLQIFGGYWVLRAMRNL
ncbi:MAG: ECF transporter S component [Prevotellaceae bacterium]|jgi:hypothetical protein|nr:ECF transporter S component [Prevotellaceae bacterium]